MKKKPVLTMRFGSGTKIVTNQQGEKLDSQKTVKSLAAYRKNLRKMEKK